VRRIIETDVHKLQYIAALCVTSVVSNYIYMGRLSVIINF